MNDRMTIFYDGGNTVEVMPGRPLRLAGEPYPLFLAPDPASVSDPDVCLDFLKTLHLSLCPVFDIKLRLWMSRYFDAVRDQADRHATALPAVAGLDPSNAHRAWCYAAYRPFSNARFVLDGAEHIAPVLLWTAEGPLVIRFSDGSAPKGVRSVVCKDAVLAASAEDFLSALGGDVAAYWRDVAAPRHPFVRSALSGLRR